MSPTGTVSNTPFPVVCSIQSRSTGSKILRPRRTPKATFPSRVFTKTGLPESPKEISFLGFAASDCLTQIASLFAEITMNEPLLDVGDLLGERGLAPVVSASINQELQRLARADRWNTVFSSLKAVHRHCHSEMAVIPLWQIAEHYAYRKNLKNSGSRISSIYQNVDRWQLDPPGEDN